MSENYIVIYATSNDLNKRIDKFLNEKLESFSRSRLQSFIINQKVTLNGKYIPSSSFKIKNLGEIRIEVPPIKKSNILAQNIKIEVIYEDSNIMVINKPAGMVVHPGAGNKEGTLVNALLYHCEGSLSGIGGIARPGIVHRIDKMTSGLLLIAKDDQTHLHLSEQFKNKTIKREYFLFCWNNFIQTKGVFESYISRSNRNRKRMAIDKKNRGKLAITEYEMIKSYKVNQNEYITFVKCELKTGRTHQIRVHMSNNGNTLVGDKLYGKQSLDRIKQDKLKNIIYKNFVSVERQALHARTIGFYHPTKKKYMSFGSELPGDFKGLLEELESFMNK